MTLVSELHCLYIAETRESILQNNAHLPCGATTISPHPFAVWKKQYSWQIHARTRTHTHTHIHLIYAYKYVHINPPAPVGAKGRVFPEALATGSFS